MYTDKAAYGKHTVHNYVAFTAPVAAHRQRRARVVGFTRSTRASFSGLNRRGRLSDKLRCTRYVSLFRSLDFEESVLVAAN